VDVKSSLETLSSPSTSSPSSMGLDASESELGDSAVIIGGTMNDDGGKPIGWEVSGEEYDDDDDDE
jgi:hypothetical protein